MKKKDNDLTYEMETRQREAKEECAAFMAKMIEKYGEQALKEIKGKKKTR